MCCIIFWVVHKQNSLPLWPIEPSSRSTKDLHALAYELKPSILPSTFVYLDKLQSVTLSVSLSLSLILLEASSESFFQINKLKANGQIVGKEDKRRLSRPLV